MKRTLPKDLEVGDLVPGLGSVTAVRRGVEVEFSDGHGPAFYDDGTITSFVGVEKPAPEPPKVGDWVRFTFENGSRSTIERRLSYIGADGLLVTDAYRFDADGHAEDLQQVFGSEKGDEYESFEVVERA
jgi:hypothetical protein